MQYNQPDLYDTWPASCRNALQSYGKESAGRMTGETVLSKEAFWKVPLRVHWWKFVADTRSNDWSPIVDFLVLGRNSGAELEDYRPLLVSDISPSVMYPVWNKTMNQTNLLRKHGNEQR